jgi:hypothetical protein
MKGVLRCSIVTTNMGTEDGIPTHCADNILKRLSFDSVLMKPLLKPILFRFSNSDKLDVLSSLVFTPIPLLRGLLVWPLMFREVFEYLFFSVHCCYFIEPVSFVSPPLRCPG